MELHLQMQAEANKILAEAKELLRQFERGEWNGGHLGSSKVVERHYCSQTYDELRLTWFDGADDEFVTLHQAMKAKLPV